MSAMWKLHESMRNKMWEKWEAVKKREETCFFCLRTSVCHSSQSHAEPFCLTARLCSLSVISVDQSVDGGMEGGEKKMDGMSAASQSRSSTSNPTEWKHVAVGIQCEMLSSPSSSSLASVQPSSRLMTSFSFSSTARLTCSDVICEKFLT